MRSFSKNNFCRFTLLAAAVVSAAGVFGCSKPRVATPGPDRQAATAIREKLVTAAVGGGGAEAAAPAGTGWGSLKGRFVFVGAVPADRPLVVDKDTEVCTKGGKKLLDRSLRVDPSSKGLADVVVFARKTSRVKDAAPPAEPLVFDQKECEFLTQVLAGRVGRPIAVKNSDPIGHNTNIAGSAFNQIIEVGKTVSYVPTGEMGMPQSVTCNIHPWMKAYMIFRKDGYVAVSAADGSFTIPDLPAGETIEFQAWHPRSMAANQVLGLEVPAVKWNAKGRFQVKVEPDGTMDLGTIEVPAALLGG
jgi:hypothetical protein